MDGRAAARRASKRLTARPVQGPGRTQHVTASLPVGNAASEPGMSKLKSELIRAHRTLCSAFVSEELFRRGLGGGRADLGTIAAYLQMPVQARPLLSVYFDRDYYLATNPEVQQEGHDPFLHFIESGVSELRSPHPLIDLQFIAAEDPEVLGTPARSDALVELLDYALADPSPYSTLPTTSACSAMRRRRTACFGIS
jgi:hypothetical protein